MGKSLGNTFALASTSAPLDTQLLLDVGFLRLEWRGAFKPLGHLGDRMMRRRFTLQHLFALTTFAALVAWCISEMNIFRYVIAVSVIGGNLAIHMRRARPIMAAAIGGYAFVATCVLTEWSFFLFGYFLHDVPRPYFEDGFVTETLIYPIAYCGIYGPFAAALAGLVGAVAVWCCHRASVA